METECSLRFAVLALRAGLINPAQFTDACTRWSDLPGRSLKEVLIEYVGLAPADQARLEELLQPPPTAQDAVMATTFVVPHSATVPLEMGRTKPAPTAAPQRYVRRHLHATGGMGRIWLAHDVQLNRNVALKELLPEVADDGALASRFIQEAQITSRLEHPGIVPVYEFAANPETNEPFYTMRFVRGRTLVSAAEAFHEKRRRGQADPLEFVSLLTAFVAVGNTIAYAHSHRILHRDLKGENVLLGDFGEVVVLDWGLAKSLDVAEQRSPAEQAASYDWLAGTEGTIQGSIIGTPGYMAPEQADGRLDLVDERTDVYGLGAILYEILTGEPPSEAPTAIEAIQRAQRGALKSPREIWPAVPPALEAACLRALAKEQDHRFASATELAQEVQRWQDVQRRAAEAALQHQSEILQSILDSMSEGVIVTDDSGRVLQINPAAERIFGSHPLGQTLTLAPGHEIYLPDRTTPCPQEQLPLARAIRGEELDDVEFFIRVPDRAKGLWASASARPLKDAHGSCRGALVVWRDVSERKRAEDELRRSRERFDLAVQGSQDGLWDWDLETDSIYYSPRWKSIIGYEDHEISARIEEWETRLHPDERERVLAANYAHIAGSTPHYEYEYRLRHKDGSYRWILARGAALRDANGKAYRMAGSHVDVTSRRESEQALKQGEDRYNAIITALPVGIVMVGTDGHVWASNPSALRLLGTSPEALARSSFFDVADHGVREDGSPFPVADFPPAASLRHGQPLHNVVMGLPAPGGERRWLSINAQPIVRSGENVPYAVVASFTDVTEFKAVEDRLKEAQAAST